VEVGRDRHGADRHRVDHDLFHTDAAMLAEVGTGYLLGRATGQQFRNGYFDQAAQLWGESGALLATSNQIVYFRE